MVTSVPAQGEVGHEWGHYCTSGLCQSLEPHVGIPGRTMFSGWPGAVKWQGHGFRSPMDLACIPVLVLTSWWPSCGPQGTMGGPGFQWPQHSSPRESSRILPSRMGTGLFCPNVLFSKGNKPWLLITWPTCPVIAMAGGRAKISKEELERREWTALRWGWGSRQLGRILKLRLMLQKKLYFRSAR